MRVLVVDDSPDVQEALTTLLRLDPAVEVVGCAVDGRAALAQIEAGAPDLVVLDVELAGGERGYDVLRRIHARHPDLAVIMLSNFGWSAMRAPFLQAGALAYFDKALEFGKAVEWIWARAAR